MGDERRSWRPNQFGYELWGSEVSFKFPIVKLLDYKQQWSAIDASSNPFATVVMAHLKAQETRLDALERFESKLAITRRLYVLGYSREDVINLFGFIDWVMSKPVRVRTRVEAANTAIRGGEAYAIHHECRKKRY